MPDDPRYAFLPDSRLARVPDDALTLLPRDERVRLEINGVLAGVTTYTPDAPREFAIGWAWMHQFIDRSSALDHMLTHSGRTVMMVETTQDLDARARAAAGFSDPELVRPMRAISHSIRVTEPEILLLAKQFADAALSDGALDGYAHAAVATRDDIACVARDVYPEHAIAKVLGWAWLERRDDVPGVLLLDAIVTELMVSSAFRTGISLIVSSVSATQKAVEAARYLRVSLVVMTAMSTPVLLNDAHHIGADNETPDDTADE